MHWWGHRALERAVKGMPVLFAAHRYVCDGGCCALNARGHGRNACKHRSRGACTRMRWGWERLSSCRAGRRRSGLCSGNGLWSAMGKDRAKGHRGHCGFRGIGLVCKGPNPVAASLCGSKGPRPVVPHVPRSGTRAPLKLSCAPALRFGPGCRFANVSAGSRPVVSPTPRFHRPPLCAVSRRARGPSWHHAPRSPSIGRVPAMSGFFPTADFFS